MNLTTSEKFYQSKNKLRARKTKHKFIDISFFNIQGLLIGMKKRTDITVGRYKICD